MAIRIKKKADNGVITNYHRIALINIDVNNETTVLVYSYLDESGRQIEKDYRAGKIPGDKVAFPFKEAVYHQLDDVDNFMTIEKAYEWLKTQPGFKGAIDC